MAGVISPRVLDDKSSDYAILAGEVRTKNDMTAHDYAPTHHAYLALNNQALGLGPGWVFPAGTDGGPCRVVLRRSWRDVDKDAMRQSVLEFLVLHKDDGPHWVHASLPVEITDAHAVSFSPSGTKYVLFKAKAEPDGKPGSQVSALRI